jgi:hypothetical protein
MSISNPESRFYTFFEINKREVWNKSRKESDGTDTMYEEITEVPNLLLKIENFKNMDDIPKEFIEYLHETLSVNELMGDVHTPVYYITPRGKTTFEHAPPEILRHVYYQFKLTKNWILFIEMYFCA